MDCAQDELVGLVQSRCKYNKDILHNKAYKPGVPYYDA